MRKWIIALVALLAFQLIVGCGTENRNHQQTEPFQQMDSELEGKKIVLIIFDSMTSDMLDQVTASGKAPAIQYLMEQGQYHKELVTAFPSMSVTIESTLVTGRMPHEHTVPGLAWYHTEEDRIVNYGSSERYWLNAGLKEGVLDTLLHLNQLHLNKQYQTIFEELGEKERTAGAINTLIYRGFQEHKLTLPYQTDKVLGLPNHLEVKGPEILYFGRFIKPNDEQNHTLSDHIHQRFGLQNRFSSEAWDKIVKNKQQPDFTMIYLPDLDHATHTEGPPNMEGFLEAEQHLQKILNSYGDWKKALQENIFIVVGDHGQDKIKDEDDAMISLERLFSGYQVAPLSERASSGDIAFGVNQRMAYVYDVKNKGIVSELVQEAKREKRIDLIVWKDQHWVHVQNPVTSSLLRFRPQGNWVDKYGQKWKIQGDPKALDLTLNHKQAKIQYGDYPDGMNHLYSALESHTGDKIILTAKPGHSFQAEGIATHQGGGDHGGLHKNDMLSAMIIAGTERQPYSDRLVDLKPYIIELLTTQEEKRTAHKKGKQKENSKKPTEKKDKGIEKSGQADQKGKKKETSRVQEKEEKKKTNHQGKGDRKSWRLGTAKKVNEYAQAIEGVTDSITVAYQKDIFVAVKTSQWHRLRLKQIRKDIFDLLSSVYPDHRIHVSTDWKIYREIEQLNREATKLKAEEISKKLEHIEKSMKG